MSTVNTLLSFINFSPRQIGSSGINAEYGECTSRGELRSSISYHEFGNELFSSLSGSIGGCERAYPLHSSHKVSINNTLSSTVVKIVRACSMSDLCFSNKKSERYFKTISQNF
eukprot:TRINITY_DN11391_c0_g1_i10.p2 TRINITY_DN11391_c0_g1~~TRINITY_DN11391_c0_g1_i10.p2  ORF type:complete len:113 (+),score=14.49 TRINITY_DN11391_c0_g1_i10:26-364(+)